MLFVRLPSRLSLLFLSTALLFVPPAGAGAQSSRTPVPTASPQAPAGSESDEPSAASPMPPSADEVPVPEARPGDAPDAAEAEPVSPDDEQADEQVGGPPNEAADGGEPQGPPAPPEEAKREDTAPQPAYVPPEKARTSPEPGAPEVPPMDVTPAETVEAAAAVADAAACEAELKERGAQFTVGRTIAEGDCGVLRPVTLTRLSSGVEVAPDTVFLCRTALALDIWAAEGVAAAAKAEFPERTVTRIDHASTYSCRARASESRISEHSRGSAIDIAGFELSDGTKLPVEATEPGTAQDRFAAAVRRAACGPFRTVLGPGTDSDHGTHLHLDIAARNNGSTYCR